MFVCPRILCQSCQDRTKNAVSGEPFFTTLNDLGLILYSPVPCVAPLRTIAPDSCFTQHSPFINLVSRPALSIIETAIMFSFEGI